MWEKNSNKVMECKDKSTLVDILVVRVPCCCSFTRGLRVVDRNIQIIGVHYYFF